MIRFPHHSALTGLALLLATPAFAAAPPITGPADLGTAVSAQVACAGIFVSGRAEADVLRDDVRALAPFTQGISLAVDREARTVTASTSGGAPRTAFYRPAAGCTLLTRDLSPAALDAQTARLGAAWTGTEGPWPQPKAAPAKMVGGALESAVAAAFDGANTGGYPDTRAVVVIQHGRILAERYAPGFDRNTRFLGWSATKSVMGTLVGILVDEGKLRLDAPAPIAEWQKPGDPRAAITLRQLLNMTSGLAFEEPYRPGSDSIRMLFQAGNMASVALARPAEHAPGSNWSYSSGTSNILSEIVFRATGGTLEGMTRFARERLFDRAGMTSFLIEPDESGVMVGSSYGYATARDWARFGLLYLNDGKANGKRLLSRDWVRFARTPSDGARQFYAGQFWLNRSDENGPKSTYFRNLPGDAFMAMGHNSQMIMVIPSHDTVIVRLGWTPEGQSFDYDKYLAPIVAALPASGLAVSAR
ncbi:serine hydrolase [Novosphingobium sp. RL4]|uniref:serine hydrolase domain-containing protein n=1 Tax=Novosphingobium sp. RL4 TaxID=3109595 RepID=UPI002D76A7C4|nr:serine hydrolase [Novosphingobium sp. RL4]WRT95802.1 serine hydrolase [Novosphingobium sp. RL4]